VTLAQIIKDRNSESCVKQFFHTDTTDITRTAGDKDVIHAAMLMGLGFVKIKKPPSVFWYGVCCVERRCPLAARKHSGI
jgi:hypothetical protein